MTRQLELYRERQTLHCIKSNKPRNFVSIANSNVELLLQWKLSPQITQSWCLQMPLIITNYKQMWYSMENFGVNLSRETDEFGDRWRTNDGRVRQPLTTTRTTWRRNIANIHYHTALLLSTKVISIKTQYFGMFVCHLFVLEDVGGMREIVIHHTNCHRLQQRLQEQTCSLKHAFHFLCRYN